VIALVLAMAIATAPAPEVGPVGRQVLVHMKKGVSQARVGDWVTYGFDGGGDRQHFWRLAIVGEERDGKGRDAFWVEIEIGEHAAMKAPMQQLRLLVAKGDGMTSSGVSRMLVAFGYEKPQELDADAMAWMLRPAPPDAEGPVLEAPKMWVRNGREARLMTPAGTVDAQPVEIGLRETLVKRIWMSRQVPVLHVAKMEIPAIGHSMEVNDYGVDARPRMVLPGPKDPKIRMERYDEALPAPDGGSDGHP
jgi:hypothetical protein